MLTLFQDLAVEKYLSLSFILTFNVNTDFVVGPTLPIV